jgi:hypothetical protein
MDFKDLAEDFLNSTILVLRPHSKAAEAQFRLAEIEFYVHSQTHPDPYTHRSPEQRTSDRFYFHKFSNGTYKSGTWKGLDVCLGDGSTFFGVLIRSVVDAATDRLIEGPCLTVNRILEHFECRTIDAFVDQVCGGKLDFDVYDASRPLHFRRLRLPRQRPIYCGPRIGLSDKWPEFRDRPYRFCTEPDRIKKRKRTLRSTKP